MLRNEINSIYNHYWYMTKQKCITISQQVRGTFYACGLKYSWNMNIVIVVINSKQI